MFLRVFSCILSYYVEAETRTKSSRVSETHANYWQTSQSLCIDVCSLFFQLTFVQSVMSVCYKSILSKMFVSSPSAQHFRNKWDLSQDYVCMRNEYFIYNQFIKIKYKIILKQKRKKHCTRHWYDTNDRININNYSYIQCKTPTCYILSLRLYSYISKPWRTLQHKNINH